MAGIEGETIIQKKMTKKVKANQLKSFTKNWQLYLFLLPAFLYYLIFHYYPMYGLQIAFKNYIAIEGIWGSPWIGFDHIVRFFRSYHFWTLLKNTLLLNMYQLALFPVSVIVALSMNELHNGVFKKWVQTITYAPHFISVVVMSGMIIAFLNPATGIVNTLLGVMGIEPISFMTETDWFKTVFVLSGEWQNLGWGAIIYLAALAGVDPQLYEAAKVDGASRMRRIWHINIPHILPTIIILLILNMGNFMAIGFEKIYLLQNPLNMDSSDVIQTYVYRSGVLGAQFSFSTAVGLFNSMINLFMLVIFNQIARKTSETSLW